MIAVDTYTQLKYKCMSCDTKFIICTETPELWSSNSTTCPDCSVSGNFIVWSELKDGEITQDVPGEGDLISISAQFQNNYEQEETKE